MFPSFTRLLRVVVPVVFLGLCAARNLPWRLADYDQAKQAFTSLEMANGGNVFFQHTPGERRLATKPPLVGWASAGLHAVVPGMDWEWAWRLPSMLATAALGVLFWRAGRALWPAAEVGRAIPSPPPLGANDAQPGGGLGISRPTLAAGGWLALGAFGLNLLTPRLATLARTDMVLALWTTVAGLLVWHRRRVGGTWTTGERWTLCGVLTAAMLTKGPIVYAFLLPGLAGVWVWEWKTERGERGEGRSEAPDTAAPIRDSPSPLSPLPSFSLPPWPWLLPLAVFALWVAAGWATVPGFYEQVVGREFLGRFDYTERAVHVRQPVWFYVAGLFGRLAPWSLLLLGTAFIARPAWRAVGREPAGRWLIAWAAGGLLLMSLIPSKRLDRIFPVVPPLCLLLTAVVGRVRETAGTGRVETLAGWTTAAALAVSVVATGYETRKSFRRHEDALDQFGQQVRRLAAARGWRPPELAAGARVDESDETLLVCLRRLRWLDNAEAAEAWRTGRTDALVLQATALEELRPALGVEGRDFTVEARMTATRAKDVPYVMIGRRREGDQ